MRFSQLRLFWKWTPKPFTDLSKIILQYRFCRFRAILVLCGLLLLRVLFFSSTERLETLDREVVYNETQRRLKELLAIEKGTGCKIPHLNLFSMEIRMLEKDVEAVACNTNGEDWVECHFSECFVTNKTLIQMKDIRCVYKDIVYVNDDYYYLGDAVTVFGKDKYTLKVSDHVKVSCKADRVGSVGTLKSRWSGYLAGYRPIKHSVVPPATSLNVLMLLFDSISKLKFMRCMPISYKMLTEQLSAVIMDSYNIVGGGTAKAIFPILSGFEDLELPDAKKIPGNTRRVDPQPLLFTLLKRHGYRTAYFEDMPHIGPFQFGYNGFERMPTDHYARPLFLEADWYHGLWWVGAKQRLCFGSKPQIQFLLDYTAELFKMSGKKFCLTFSNVYSHDFGGNMIKLIDEDFAEFLHKFKEAGHLEDTLLFVMSDHGARFSELRNTHQGKMEELLPFVSIVLPERLKRSRPDAVTNLLSNSKVLTTPFDIHSTILDALELKAHRNTYKVPGADLERGMSLLDYIPATRSCAEAAILPKWCSCTRWYNVSTEDPVYIRVVRELVAYVNRATEKVRDKCAERHLLSVSWVRGLNTVSADNSYFQAKIVMDPGIAVYEGYVQHRVKDNFLMIYDKDVVRANKYGDEPKCIKNTNPSLNEYCYCIN